MALKDLVAKFEALLGNWTIHVDPETAWRSLVGELVKAVDTEMTAHKSDIDALRAQVADLVAKVGADAKSAAAEEIGKVAGEAAATIAPVAEIPPVGSAIGLPQAAPLEPKAP